MSLNMRRNVVVSWTPIRLVVVSVLLLVGASGMKEQKDELVEEFQPGMDSVAIAFTELPGANTHKQAIQESVKSQGGQSESLDCLDITNMIAGFAGIDELVELADEIHNYWISYRNKEKTPTDMIYLGKKEKTFESGMEKVFWNTDPEEKNIIIAVRKLIEEKLKSFFVRDDDWQLGLFCNEKRTDSTVNGFIAELILHMKPHHGNAIERKHIHEAIIRWVGKKERPLFGTMESDEERDEERDGPTAEQTYTSASRFVF